MSELELMYCVRIGCATNIIWYLLSPAVGSWSKLCLTWTASGSCLDVLGLEFLDVLGL